ncbi:MAG: NusG domain II-containing protein [Clostridia bacterium]|nr:NusG domain II-containing protein [Clostridia bacterium]
MRKADIILLVILLVLCACSAVFAFRSGSAGDKAVVTCGGEIYGTYPLSEDREIIIENAGHINKITINDGQVQMTEASCQNQICVKHGAISKDNETIVCLPNRVVVRIESEGGDYDAVI